jgi:hypothetical protein
VLPVTPRGSDSPRRSRDDINLANSGGELNPCRGLSQGERI